MKINPNIVSAYKILRLHNLPMSTVKTILNAVYPFSTMPHFFLSFYSAATVYGLPYSFENLKNEVFKLQTGFNIGTIQ